MATPSTGDLRNFARLGHASSGKTTLSEAMLACAGVKRSVPGREHRAGITENDETRNPNQGENEPSCLIAAGRGARIFPVSTSRSSRRKDLQSSWRI
jgi:elongation factor G